MEKTVNKTRGFTLIELIVVVIIIGIIATFAMPGYRKSVERANIAKAFYYLDNLRKAEIAYRVENDSYYYFNYGGQADANTILGTELPLNGEYDFGVYYPSNPGVYARKIKPPYLDGRITKALPSNVQRAIDPCYFSTYNLGAGSGECGSEPKL